MTAVIKPLISPRWADTSPPAGTLTEPSEPEKNEGFQPGSLAQADDFVITVVNTFAYAFTLGSTVITYTSDGTATKPEILAGLIAALVASGLPITGTDNGSGDLRVTANVAGQAFAVSAVSANLAHTLHTANRTGKIVRQYINWLFMFVCAWVSYLAAALLHWEDFGLNWADGGGALPVTSGTLIGTSGAGPAYVSGRRVAGDNVAHTYTLSRDTYVDLDYENVWHYNDVANGAGAPALAANNIRLFKVVTSAGAITSVVDLREKRIRFRQPARFDRRIDVGTNIPFSEPAVGHSYDDGSGSAYVFDATHECFQGTTAAHGIVRYYTDSSGQPVITRNAGWDAVGVQWVADVDGDAVFLRFLKTGKIQAQRFPSAVAATPWADGGWTNQVLGVQSVIELAQLLPATTPAVYMDTGSVTGGRSELFDSLDPSVSGVARTRVFLTRTGDGLGYAFEICENCKWDGATALWSRDVAGGSRKHSFSALGYRQLSHSSGGSATWVDTVAGGTWNIDAQLNQQLLCDNFIVNSGAVNGMLRINGDALKLFAAGGVTTTNPLMTDPQLNRQVAKSVCKAWAHVTIDNAGAVTSYEGFNIASMAISDPGTDHVLHVTFAEGLRDIKYHVPPPGNHGSSTPGLCQAYNLATGGFDIALTNYAGSLIALHNVTLSFSVFGTQEG